MDVPKLVDILTLLARGVGVGAVIAFLFEKMDWFQRASPRARWWIIFSISLALPVLAQAALLFIPADAWTAIEVWWRALAAGFLVWSGSQVVHRLVNSK